MIKHNFVIYLRKVPREVSKPGLARGFQHYSWDLANVYELKIIFESSIKRNHIVTREKCIKISNDNSVFFYQGI